MVCMTAPCAPIFGFVPPHALCLYLPWLTTAMVDPVLWLYVGSDVLAMVARSVAGGLQTSRFRLTLAFSFSHISLRFVSFRLCLCGPTHGQLPTEHVTPCNLRGALAPCDYMCTEQYTV